MKYQKWFPYQILGGQPVKNVQIDPQQQRNGQKSSTTRERVCDIYLIRELRNHASNNMYKKYTIYI